MAAVGSGVLKCAAEVKSSDDSPIYAYMYIYTYICVYAYQYIYINGSGG